ncbi:tetratricopeptide repeat protein 31-like isoform X2 [Chiloscyllium plagiosum]|uniref:tetratricopeptide repeat protein 31-like isoform X2 n=1 Tax=Chiloscyllium plagiosum TaxID=36176 RepID=UPI001CB82F99|nr:tetratricopeptide repeat protein 31-like isoform X2 [Chiloscyllium plagiosum]
MSGSGGGYIDPIWWRENEGCYLSTLTDKANVYHHNLQDNPVTNQRLDNFLKDLIESSPVEVHQCVFNEETAIMEQHVFDSSDDDDNYTYEDDYSNDDDDHNVDTFCGLRKNFLYNAPELSTFKNITDPYNNKSSNSYRGSAEEAERIAQELVNEEEQAKKKAEKRRLKKKRQKERRRQQKLEKENRSENKFGENVNDKKVLSKKESCSDGEEDDKEVSGNIKRGLAVLPEKGASAGKEQSSDTTDSKNENSVKVTAVVSEDENAIDKSVYISEDELDMNSSFVSKAVTQMKRKMNIKPKVEKKETEKKKGEKKVEQTTDPNALSDKIYNLAVQGNSMANEGRYEDAVEYFTEAIKYDPKEYRLFGNRSYCYERLKQYSRALSDAQIAVNLNPSWPKGYFRKARALAGVKRYIEAIEAFQEVLKIDSSCKDAECELVQVQMQLLMERGFTQQQCDEILFKYGSLEETLLSSAPKPRNSQINASTYVSDEDDKDFVRVKKSKNKPASMLVQPQLQPRELFPIWIGNVTTRITEEALRRIFETVGTIHSIRMLQDRFCAFINYTTKQGAEQAITKLQGTELEGTKLLIRHPDNIYKNLGAAKTAAPATKPSLVEKVKIPPTLECHFWRNVGCVYGDKCRFRHIPQHKGVDTKVTQN